MNVLIAAIWTNHSHHSESFAWLAGKELVICPLAELGFLRISTNKKAINAPKAVSQFPVTRGAILHYFAHEKRGHKIPL